MKRFLETYSFPAVATAAVFLYAFSADRKDGSIEWALLALGTLIAAAGFFGGARLVSYLARRRAL